MDEALPLPSSVTGLPKFIASFLNCTVPVGTMPETEEITVAVKVMF